MKNKAMEFGVSAEEYEGLDRMALIWNKTREVVSRIGFDEERGVKVMNALNQLVAAHEEEEHEDSILLLGVKEILKELKTTGYQIGVVTNTSECELLKIFHRFGFGRYIDLYITRDYVNYLKPNPELVEKILKEFRKKRFVYVGDADHDAQAAKSAGGYFIMMNTRGYDRETIESIGPDAVIDSLHQLPDILKRLKKQ